jgi:hypothetical protein
MAYTAMVYAYQYPVRVLFPRWRGFAIRALAKHIASELIVNIMHLPFQLNNVTSNKPLPPA